MSELTSGLCQSIEFKHKDKTYQVSLITQKIKSLYEKKQFSRARDAAIMLKECMNSSEYQEHLRELNQSYIRGDYSLDSENGIAYAQTAGGSVLLTSLLFNISEEEMTKLLLEAKAEVMALLSVVISESFGTTVTPVVDTPIE